MSKHAYYDNIGYLRNFDLAKAHVIATWVTTNGGEPHDLEQILRVDDADDGGALYIEASRKFASRTIRYDQISEREANQTIACWRKADREVYGWQDWRAMYGYAFA